MIPIISVQGLSKQYRIGKSAAYKTVRESLMNVVTSPARLFKKNDGDETIWALKNVSFEVNEGDVVGIIGRNGAGKSTLLKILSSITEPTEGEVRLRGRVGSLLEVGTGFHPELTGRENIFLNGAILGMRKDEIKRKFDEIVAFAEIDKFLDTPVKRYSSGMYVRLAFAVAAHLEPEILIVDEVLAVGDAKFQKKCLGKMGEVAKEGRTVLFVSHNMGAIYSLCNIGILLDFGLMSRYGSVSDTIHAYNELLRSKSLPSSNKIKGACVNSILVVGDVKDSRHTSQRPLDLEVTLYNTYTLPNCYLNLVVEDSEDRALIHSRTDLMGSYPTIPPGTHKIRIHIPRLSIRAGVYTVWFRLYSNNREVFQILDSERIMLEVDGPQVGGMVDVACRWVLDGLQLQEGEES